MKFNYYGFKAIYVHEMNRFIRTLGQSLLSPVISTSLYFVVFGSVIGSYIQKIDGVSYGSYIVPGLLMLTLLTQSISNTSFGIFFPKFNGTINEILAAPISTLETVLAFVGAGATKTLLVGAVIFGTATFFAEITVKYPLLMIFLLVLVSFTFALFGFLIGVVSKNFEQMSLIYTYNVQAEKTGITDLLQSVKDTGFKLKDLKTEQSTLEKIFVKLVKENNEI